MPNTLIREGYLDSDRVSSLSDFDDRVFFRILLAADDAGRVDGRTDKLRAAIFPTREAVRSTDIARTVARLIQADLITQWSFEDKPVVQVLRWQRRSGAQYSKHPDEKGNFKITWVERQTRDGELAFCSTSLPKGSVRVGKPIDNPFGGVSEKSAYTETETETETKAPSGVPPGFGAFWSGYPRIGRERTSRKKCLSLWKKQGLEQRSNAINAGLTRWLASKRWAEDGGKFVKNAYSWLNDEMFAENPEPAESVESENGFQRRVLTPSSADDFLPEGGGG